jgi:hypothetical protein
MTTAEVRPDEAGARGSSTSAQSLGYFGRPQCRSPSVVVAEEAEESDPALTTHPESGGCRFKRGGAVTPGLIFLVQAAVVVVVPAVLLRVSELKGLVPLVVAQIVVGIALGHRCLVEWLPKFTRCSLILPRYQLFGGSDRSPF